MITLNQIRQGSIVMVRGDFGLGNPVRAVVDAVEQDVKNGCPGIDYTEVNTKAAHWAYLEQVDSVVKY